MCQKKNNRTIIKMNANSSANWSINYYFIIGLPFVSISVLWYFGIFAILFWVQNDHSEYYLNVSIVRYRRFFYVIKMVGLVRISVWYIRNKRRLQQKQYQIDGVYELCVKFNYGAEITIISILTPTQAIICDANFYWQYVTIINL